jgi:hypothetical protein
MESAPVHVPAITHLS